MFHVYCTAANSTEYVKYNQHGPRGINVAERSVLIKGGAGINKKNVQTPLGVHTAVEDEDMEWLKDDFSFKQLIKNGYISVRKQKVDPEVAAADMVTRDQKTDACPIVPQDFTEKAAGKDLTAVKPKVNKAA
jgi:hypothetical protein